MWVNVLIQSHHFFNLICKNQNSASRKNVPQVVVLSSVTLPLRAHDSRILHHSCVIFDIQAVSKSQI